MASVELRPVTRGSIRPGKPRLLNLRLVDLRQASLSALLATTLITGCASPSLRLISVTPATGSTILTAQNQTAQFHAIATYQQGTHAPTTQDVTNTVQWASNSESVATVDSSGVVTALGTGVAVITATLNGSFGVVQGTSNVQVNLALDPGHWPDLNLGRAVDPANSCHWPDREVCSHRQLHRRHSRHTGSDNAGHLGLKRTGVATINGNGIATAVSAGTATITASGRSSSGAAVIGTATITVSSSNASGLAASTNHSQHAGRLLHRRDLAIHRRRNI